MKPDKLPSGSQALDWHLTDESLFTHPGKTLQKCMWTDTWEKIDVKDRWRTFSSQLDIQVKSLARLPLYSVFLKCCLPHVACPQDILFCIYIFPYRVQLCGVKSVVVKEKKIFLKAIQQQTVLNKACTTEQHSLIIVISFPMSSKKCFAWFKAFGDSQAMVWLL